MGSQTTHNQDKYDVRKVYYSGSDVLYPGYALCLDITNAGTQNEQEWVVTQATFANAGHMVGVVKQGQGALQGPCFVEVIQPHVRTQGVQVSTNENVAVGDLLFVVPGQYQLGRAPMGSPVFQSREAVDRSTTAGLCRGELGGRLGTAADAMRLKVARYFSHYINKGFQSTADAGDWLQTLTGSGTSTGADSAHGGRWLITTGATDANLNSYQMNGEALLLGAGKACFCDRSFKINTVATADFFFGWAATDTSLLASAPTDYIGFRMIGASALTPLMVIRKASGTEVADAVVPVMADATDMRLSIIAINRASGKNLILFFVNGALVGTYANNAQFPDTVAMTPSFELRTSGGSASKTMSIDWDEFSIAL